MSWPLEKITSLRALCAGPPLSASTIATLLGVSRNGVIGKCRSLGIALPFAMTPEQKRARLEPKPQKQAPRPRGSPLRPIAASPFSITAAWREPIPEPPQPPRDPWAALPSSRPCSLVDLTGTACRWPLGDPTEPDFRFCGGICAPEDTYCAEHHARSIGSGTPSERRATHAPGSSMAHPGGASKLMEVEG